MRVLAVIPARFEATRLPGKPLADICGKPMIQHVVEKVSQVIPDVIVATDDTRILHCVESFGGCAELTAKSHPSGTDRVFEVVQRHPEFDLIVNVQGDEPLLNCAQLQRFVSFLTHKNTQMASIAEMTNDATLFANPNCVKVVVDTNHKALYFSRSAIPHSSPHFLRHIGIYGFHRRVLEQFVRLAPSLLETSEKLEQLRAISNNIAIMMMIEPEAHHHHPVDTKEDLQRVIKIITEKNQSRLK